MTPDGAAPADTRKPAAGERRRFSRAGVRVTAELLLGTRSVPCIVTELSPGGALLSLDARLPTLGPATLRIEGAGAFHCRIAWSRAGQAGICFLHDADWNAERLAAIVNAR